MIQLFLKYLLKKTNAGLQKDFQRRMKFKPSLHSKKSKWIIRIQLQNQNDESRLDYQKRTKKSLEVAV